MHEWPRTLIFAFVAFTLAFFIIYPLGTLVYHSLYNKETDVWSIANYVRFFTQPDLYGSFVLTFKL